MYVDVLFPKQAVARSTPLSRKEQLEEQLREGDVEALWRVPDERNDSGFMETQPPQITGVALYEHTQPGDIKTLPRASSAGPLPSEDESPAKLLGTDLNIGCWVEFSTHGNWDRWQLTWSKPDRDLFMFTDVEGLNRTLTSKVLKEMLDSGQASLLSSTES